MKLDLSTKLLNPKGEPFLREGQPMTLGDALYVAVTESPKCGAAGNPSERRERGLLADKLCAAGVIDVTPAEKAVLVEDCEAVFNGIMLVRIDRIFAQAVLDEAKPVADLAAVKESTG